MRLHKTLLARRADLGKKLAGELTSLCGFKAADSTGDSADWAFDAGTDEMSSRLAELDARELNQIEPALVRLKLGTYGLCEGTSENCQKRILVARLNALPYTTFCINCEREREKHPEGLGRWAKDNWDQIFDSEAHVRDQRINLSELEMELSDNR